MIVMLLLEENVPIVDAHITVNENESNIGYSTGKWSDDDDWNPITPFFGPNR